MLSSKDNFMTVLHGGCPEWVPGYSLADSGFGDPPIIYLMPPMVAGHRKFGVGGKDVWGVEYVPTASTNGGCLPKPGQFILEDVRRWRDVIKAPDLSHTDWERVAKQHMADAGVNRSVSALSVDTHIGYFQHLMAFMGFENGLCALYEEKEACKELLDYLADFYIGILEAMIDYYQPDAIALKDDTATATAPFVSLEMFREFFVPLYQRQARCARERGLPITFHNCGRCEALLPPLVEEVGVTLWEPAQTSNDLAGIKARYGNRLVIAGGWEPTGRLLEADVTDEEIEASVRDTIMTLGPGGGYCFSGGYFGLMGDEETARKSRVVQDAYLKYRAAPYGG